MVDLSGVDFMDSTALGVLMNALRRMGWQRRELRIVCAPGEVRRVFELTGLDGTFSLYASLTEALAAPHSVTLRKL